MKPTRSILFLLCLAFLVRLCFLYPQFSGDVKNHLVWGDSFLVSPIGFYTRHFPGFNDPNYPPLAIFLFALSNLILTSCLNILNFLNHNFAIFPSLLVPLFNSENMRMGFLKLPAIFADLGTGWFLYKIIRERSGKLPLLMASFYLFNPAVIYISSVWGQIESLTIFFLIYSIYQTIYGGRKKFISIGLFVLAALVKQTALWFIPFFLLFWLKEIKIREFARGVLLGIATFILAYLPFGLLPWTALKIYFSSLSGSSTVVADAAWNLWSFFYRTGTPDSVSLGFLTLRQFSIFLLVTILIFLLTKLYRHFSMLLFYKYLFIWSLAIFFLQTRVHERHLAFSLVFLLLIPRLNLRLILLYFMLTVYHLGNLFSSLKLSFW